ncbi:DNA-processing protein DprA [Pseudonocardia sp.]|uniref:DNA-processing protein DprA n=1 Tax=Pseudonocardia sp. TaxID=60912 RepID=UPI00262B5056|nr:DNA-processing protein DprA [Pseudonocardia sp.]
MSARDDAVVPREPRWAPDLLARAYLSRVAEPPAPGLAGFVVEVGPVEAAERVRRGDVPAPVAAETAARRGVERAAADLAAAAASGMRLLTPEHPEWPAGPFEALAGCGVGELAPPVALWVTGPGRLAALCERAVAVVGARAATGYGTHVAGELGAALAQRSCTVVSGAAIGIDGAAHRGALGAAGATVAVLACGADRAYPRAHETLLARIAGTGLVVSEYPPGSVPGRHRFLVRNRLIAGLAAGTVVVEAGLRSGATRTATDTASLGRPVMAVPGPVTSGMSAGCHRLLREGAVLVTRAEEVLEGIGPIGAQLALDPPVPRRATDGLEPAAQLVHDAFPAGGACGTRWLAEEAGVPLGAVRVALVELERRDLVEHRDGSWRLHPRSVGR